MTICVSCCLSIRLRWRVEFLYFLTIPSRAAFTFASSPRLGLNCRRKLAAAPDVLRNKTSGRRRLSRCQCLMSSKFEMLSSVAHKTDVAAGSVAYPGDDGCRCAVSTGVLPASGGTFSAVSAAGCFPDRVSVSSAAWLRVTARKGLLLLEDGRGLTSLGSGQGCPSRISEIPA